MNMNPWHVESMAQYERECIRAEMRQIRLEEKALKARVRAPRLVLKVWKLFFQRLQAGRRQTPEVQRLSTLAPSTGKGEAKI